MQENNERIKQIQIELEKKLRRVSPDLFSEFLYSRGVHPVQCPMCKSEHLSIPQVQMLTVGPDGSGATSFVNYVTLVSDGPRFSMDSIQYRLICNNCGFTSHFAVMPVLKWMEDMNK